jgi:phosphoribosylglycinamide formyltransferase 1
MKIGVLASGAGTNLQAILDSVHGHDGIEVVGVASDRAGAPALERARTARVPAEVFASGDYANRDARDIAMAQWLGERGVELVVLAGFMQLLNLPFLKDFPRGVINVHPALLPAFPGLNPIGDAVAYGVKVFGVTVHYVDEGVDSGPVILQRAIEIPDATDPEAVHDLLRPIEHELLTEAIRLIADDRVRVEGRRVVVAR